MAEHRNAKEWNADGRCHCHYYDTLHSFESQLADHHWHHRDCSRTIKILTNAYWKLQMFAVLNLAPVTRLEESYLYPPVEFRCTLPLALQPSMAKGGKFFSMISTIDWDT